MPERHAFDGFALLMGLLAMALGGLALLARTDTVHVDTVVVLATFWLVIGVTGLVRAVARLLTLRGPRR